MILKRKIDENFFKNWTSEMSYVLGYIVADGCISSSKDRPKSFIINITSKDKIHLEKIKKVLQSEYKISKKPNGTGGIAYQFQVRNNILCTDLTKLGISVRKTQNLKAINVPSEYFADFVRGFFDGDGTVYTYKVNAVWQIKFGFVSVSLSFINDLNKKLCKELSIPLKNIHINKTDGKMTKYSIDFYISDTEKFFEFIYGNNPTIYLSRKMEVFEKWKLIKRRKYVKQNIYPSKIGWHLNTSAR